MAIAAAPAVAFALLADWLAPRVPFEVEVHLAGRFSDKIGASGDVQSYLQALSDRMAQAQRLPSGMSVKLHYREEPVVNAFATLGGHVVVYRGLLRLVPDENTLAMVLAHEVAHVRHRHPITVLGRGLAMAAVIATVSGAAGNDVAGRALGDAGLLTQLSFSRAQEEDADATALAALVQAYGHAGAAGELFALMRKAARLSEPPKFLSTHPLSEARVARLASLARERNWASDGARTPLPATVREQLAKDGAAPARADQR
ncbi:MAG: M48 family metallopeptidase [Pseudomonadota bacterium]